MHIERSEPGHGPYHLRQHSESHHYLQVSPVRAKMLHKLGVLHLDRLKHGQVLRQGILLNRRCLQCVLMSSYRFVGLRYHSHHIISTFYKALEGFYRKLRCSHKYNSQIFFLHFLLSSFLYLLFFHFNRALSFTFLPSKLLCRHVRHNLPVDRVDLGTADVAHQYALHVHYRQLCLVSFVKLGHHLVHRLILTHHGRRLQH